MKLTPTQQETLRMLARPGVELWTTPTGARISNHERCSLATVRGLEQRGLIKSVSSDGFGLETWAITEYGRVWAGAKGGVHVL